MNTQQISRVALDPGVVDCIVFWTKNPAPLLVGTDALDAYRYYVQFTLNPYGPEMESALPPLEERVRTFRQLAAAIGPHRVVWRVSPLLFSPVYTETFHLGAFARMAGQLQGCTEQVKLGFLDLYRKNRAAMQAHEAQPGGVSQQVRLAKQFAAIAADHGMLLSACGPLDLAAAGLAPTGCVDRALIEQLAGGTLHLGRDTGQRPDCYCTASVDIGAYDSCPAGCAYCYANRSPALAQRHLQQHDPASPLLLGRLLPGERVIERPPRSQLD